MLQKLSTLNCVFIVLIALSMLVRADGVSLAKVDCVSLEGNAIPAGNQVEGDRVKAFSAPALLLFRSSVKPAQGTILLFPGGGYGILEMQKEGENTARFLNQQGFDVALLEYHVASGPQTRELALADAVAAFRLLKSKAADLRLHDRRFGIMGYSAGGHLAARTVQNLAANEQPDDLILVYPAYLNEPMSGTDIPALLPPQKPNRLFVTIASNDNAEWVRSSEEYAKQWKASGGTTAFHLLPNGGHGFGMEADGTDSTRHWTDLLQSFLLAKPVKLHVYTIGDSTVQFWPPANYPKTGWGQVIQHFFNPESVVFHNEARGGTSSKSYYNNYWVNTRKQLNAGDFVFVQFGINDMNTNSAIHTMPMTEFKDYLAKYVEETRAKGAYPVLMTPMQWNKLPRGGSWGLYPEAIRQEATALKVPLIDLDTASAALRDSVGTNYSTRFIYMNLPAGAYSNYPAGNIDNTHLQEMGAIEMARLVVQGVKNLASDPNIGKLISGLSPTYKVTFTGNNCGGLITRTESFPAGVTVTAKAMPYAGFGFTGWRGDLNSTNAIASFVMDAADKTIEAKFNAVSGTYLLPDNELMKQAEPITYKVTPQENLRLYVLRPPGNTARPLPAIVYFTGGGWVNGTPDGMIANAAWWRDQGIIGITADYRVKSRHGTTPLECIKDGKSAIRYIRAHARELGIDPDRIIAAGGSAGGHVAAATELPGNDETNEDLQVSSKPDALVLHNPVLGEGFGVDFFTAHPDCSPILGVDAGWPPTILSCGTLDHTTPYTVAEQFVQRMKAAGNVCVLISVNNAEHSCDWPATNAHFLPNMIRMEEFLRANKIISRKYEDASSASHPSANFGHASKGADLDGWPNVGHSTSGKLDSAREFGNIQGQ